MRDKFAGRLAFVLAMAGSAIGLGNIWRFPYMVGEHGGALFIILYIVCGGLVALPTMFCESIIGRHSGKSAGHAFKKIHPQGGWKYLGLLCVLASFIIFSYYSVVGGWSVNYLVRSFLPQMGAPGAGSEEVFTQVATSNFEPVIYFAVFIILSAIIVGRGITKGIESFSKFCMPVLAGIVIVMMVYSCLLPGASEGIKYLIRPDFSQLKASTFAYALGQSFFSMSLGVGAVITYSSFIGKDVSLGQAGVMTWIFDTVFAIIAGFAVMPAVFASGLQPGEGPSLVFETFPYIFGNIMASTPVVGKGLMILFFLMIVLAALTSSVSMMEVCTEHLAEKKSFTRNKATTTITIASLIVGALCALSFGPLSGIKIFGLTIFSALDTFTSNFAMTFGALFIVIFVAWVMPKPEVKEEFTNNGSLKISSKLYKPFYFWIKWVVPVMILIVTISNFVM